MDDKHGVYGFDALDWYHIQRSRNMYNDVAWNCLEQDSQHRQERRNFEGLRATFFTC